MTAPAEYRQLIAEVAATVEQANREARAGEAHYEAQCRQLEEQLDAARATVAAQQENAALARAEIERADSTTDRVWRDVRSYVGRRRAQRLPDLPEPQLAPSGSDPEQLLSAAKDLMAQARRGEWMPDGVRYSGVLAGLTGALVALIIVAFARLLQDLSGADAIVPTVLAKAAVFLSPFAGIPLVAWGMARFWAQRPGVGTVVCTVLGGLVVSCALTFLIR